MGELDISTLVMDDVVWMIMGVSGLLAGFGLGADYLISTHPTEELSGGLRLLDLSGKIVIVQNQVYDVSIADTNALATQVLVCLGIAAMVAAALVNILRVLSNVSDKTIRLLQTALLFTSGGSLMFSSIIYGYFYDRYLINPFFKTQPSSIAESSALTTQITSLASLAFMVLVVALAVKRFLRKEINTNYQHCNGYAIRDTSVEESPKPSTFPQNIAVLVAGGCLISAAIFYGPYVAEIPQQPVLPSAHTWCRIRLPCCSRIIYNQCCMFILVFLFHIFRISKMDFVMNIIHLF